MSLGQYILFCPANFYFVPLILILSLWPEIDKRHKNRENDINIIIPFICHLGDLFITLRKFCKFTKNYIVKFWAKLKKLKGLQSSFKKWNSDYLFFKQKFWPEKWQTHKDCNKLWLIVFRSNILVNKTNSQSLLQTLGFCHFSDQNFWLKISKQSKFVMNFKGL